MDQSIEVSDIGPVRSLSIPLPAGGGVVLLKGRNGRGKTETLKSLSRLTGGKDTVSVRDGQRQGFVRIGDAKLTVGRTTRRTGVEELEVHSLEGRFDVGRFCEPGIDDPAAADAKRIKMLVSLSGQAASPDLFHELMGGPEALKAIVPPEDTETEDIVLLAARVKKRLEAEARKFEGQTENAERDAHGYRVQADGVNLEAEADSESLQDSLTAAIRSESDIRSRAELVERTRKAADAARKSLEEAEGQYHGRTIEETEANLEDAEAREVAANDKVRELEAALGLAKAAVRSASEAREMALRDREAARHHLTMVDAWRKQIDAAGSVEPVDVATIALASSAVLKAKKAVEDGAVIRKAREAMEKATQADGRAREFRRKAEARRSQAAGVDDVLSGLVAKFCKQLRVEAGRLVTTTKRGKTPFGELSNGEKRHLALDVAIDIVGENGLLTMDEWSTLDPVAQHEVAEHLVRRRAILVATLATGEPLHAEVFGEETAVA